MSNFSANNNDNDNPFLDDYIEQDDEHLPLKNNNQYNKDSTTTSNTNAKVEFTDFSHTSGLKQEETVNDIFHTYYYKKNVPYSDIYNALVKIYKLATSKRNFITLFKSVTCNNGETDLETGESIGETDIEYKELDFGSYFPIWTCLSLSLVHLIISTITLKFGNVIFNTILLALISFFTQYATLVYNYKRDTSKQVYLHRFFMIGVGNAHYLILRLTVGLLLMILPGRMFIPYLVVLLWQLLFILLSFAINEDLNNDRHYKLRCFHLEILKWILFASLDFFI